MSDATDSVQGLGHAGATAGSLLRQARQAQGLHIAALAAAIKVTPRKLELLESDRLDELPDATFTRALAQTVCRSLKIDAGPVLALLPPPGGHRLEQINVGLNAPFRERPGRLDASDWESLLRPAVWGPALVLVAAAAVWFAPAGLLKVPEMNLPQLGAGGTPEPAASDSAALPAAAESAAAASAPGAAPALVETVFSAPDSALGAASAADPTVAPVAGALQLRTSAECWVEVLDGRWQPLLSRLVQPGETIGLEGTRPFRLKIGNAAVTQVVFLGKPIELAPFTRENVAKLELK